jgi:hypothetical protein
MKTESKAVVGFDCNDVILLYFLLLYGGKEDTIVNGPVFLCD